MRLINDVIICDLNQNDAAIVVERNLNNQQLIASFAPTKASVKVLTHLQQAVLPNASQEARAINLWGSYGSGKSHLAVVIAQLMRDGCQGVEFDGFLSRLNHFGQAQLAQQLLYTFKAKSHPDARPYLLVSLYGSETSSIGAKLIEGLYDALSRHPELDPQAILPATEYEVGAKRFVQIVSMTPSYENADLQQWQLAEDYLTTAEMLSGLKTHQASALKTFKAWHEQVCHGAVFNPKHNGGKNFIEAYLEAGKNLAEKHQFGGIVVLWDELGYALEELIGNPQRSALEEIMDLQRFVETVCKPALGHTVFIGLTHKSFPQYATDVGANEGIKNRLETIEGRFAVLKIELNEAESEGYHLLGMQKSWTETGLQLRQAQTQNFQQLLETCQTLPLFKNLQAHLIEVLNDCYPLHPILAAGLFALAGYAQSNRTALTFFKENAKHFLNCELADNGLFGQELIRLPELADYYADSLQQKRPKHWQNYQQALGKISLELNTVASVSRQHAILKCLFLAQLLGESFQATDSFLAAALYDSKPNNSATQQLQADLASLKAAEICWKHDVTEQWTLAGDTGVNIEEMISGKLPQFQQHSNMFLFESYPDMLADLLAPVGVHDLEPSGCGIVRSYQVQLLSVAEIKSLKPNTPLISASLYLILAYSEAEASQAQQQIAELTLLNAYFWLPVMGIHTEKIEVDGKWLGLKELLCRYLALKQLLQDNSGNEELQRQLQAKWEKTRQQLLNLLQVFYGRLGLESGKSQILMAGQAAAIACHSWHGLRELIAQAIQNSYSDEIPVRARNLNTLRDESYLGRSIVENIVKRILDFADNSNYQNDLLGNGETSEPAALVDGLLGANQLFIQRPDGWDIKQVSETDNGVKKVLVLIHDTLLRKRDKPYLISGLRENLIAPPYGIPACCLAIFAAIAIRHEVKRLRWYGSKDNDFATNLNNAFAENSKLSIRLIEFSNKQYAILQALGLYFKMPRAEKTPEEYGNECAAKLREFIKQQPEAVKTAAQLNEHSKALLAFLKEVAKSTQDLADFLLNRFELENKSHVDITELALPLLKKVLDDFYRIADAKKYEIQQTWQQLAPKTEVEKQELLARLTHANAQQTAKQLATLLENSADVSLLDADELATLIQQKPCCQCSDREIGQCQAKLENLIEYQPPASESTSKINITTVPVNYRSLDTGNGFYKEEFVRNLKNELKKTGLNNAAIRTLLTEILQSYGDD